MSTPQEQFKAGDASSYDRVANRFDYWTRRVTQPFAERAAELAEAGPGDRALDVGTGSGVVAFAVAKRIAPQGKVVGIDLSDGMLSEARARASNEGTENLLDFRNMDAEALGFEDASFDAVLSLFAVLHFPNPQRALSEMFRVLKPGKRLVVGIGSRATFSLAGFRALTEQVCEHLDAARGRKLVAPALLDALVQRHLPCPSENENPRSGGHLNLQGLLREIGFLEIKTEFRSHKHSVASAADFWDLQATFSSVARKRLSSASAVQQDRIRAEFFERCGRVLGSGGTLVYRNGALIVSGIRPDNRAS